MTKIFLNGCCGRMGKVIVNLCSGSDEYEIVAGGDIVSNPDYKFPVYSDLKECNEDFDVIIITIETNFEFFFNFGFSSFNFLMIFSSRNENTI